MADVENYSGIECPYCGYVSQDDGTDEFMYEESDTEMICGSCHKDFIWNCVIIKSWYSSKIESGGE